MLLDDQRLNGLTHNIIGAAIEVHRHLGPGLLESIYFECLLFELHERRIRCVSQRPLPIAYKGAQLAASYRIDLMVEEMVVVEVKSIERLLPVHTSQVLTYLRITGCPAGLLINFNVPRLMDGVKRVLLTRRGEGALNGSETRPGARNAGVRVTAGTAGRAGSRNRLGV